MSSVMRSLLGGDRMRMVVVLVASQKSCLDDAYWMMMSMLQQCMMMMICTVGGDSFLEGGENERSNMIDRLPRREKRQSLWEPPVVVVYFRTAAAF